MQGFYRRDAATLKYILNGHEKSKRLKEITGPANNTNKEKHKQTNTKKKKKKKKIKKNKHNQKKKKKKKKKNQSVYT